MLSDTLSVMNRCFESPRSCQGSVMYFRGKARTSSSLVSVAPPAKDLLRWYTHVNDLDFIPLLEYYWILSMSMSEKIVSYPFSNSIFQWRACSSQWTWLAVDKLRCWKLAITSLRFQSAGMKMMIPLTQRSPEEDEALHDWFLLWVFNDSLRMNASRG